MKNINYIIQEIKIISENVVYLNLSPKKPEESLDFKPGQYALISFLQGKSRSPERPFSIMSSPTKKDSIQFGFKIFGEFTHEISQLKEGDNIFVHGPYGSFTFDEKKHNDTVFLAAGIGITPFISMFRYATEKNLSNKLTLIFSNKTIQEIPFYEEIKNSETSNKNFKTIFTITNETNIPEHFTSGRINEKIILDAVNNSIQNKTFFICGPQGFTETMIDSLKKLGVKNKNIILEGFSMAPKSFFEKGSWAFPAVISASALLMFMGLYLIHQLETNKSLIKEAEAKAYVKAYEEKIAQIKTLDQQIINHKNAVLAEQKAKTTTKIVKRYITPKRIVSLPTTTPSIQPNPVVNSPTPTATNPKPIVTPKPTVSPKPVVTAKPDPAPAPKPAKKPRTTQS